MHARGFTDDQSTCAGPSFSAERNSQGGARPRGWWYDGKAVASLSFNAAASFFLGRHHQERSLFLNKNG